MTLKEMNDKVFKLIGSPAERNEKFKDLRLEERITRNADWQKMYDKLSKMVERFGEESLNVAFTREDHMGKEGTTANGKAFYWATNNGTERRSWYCGSLWIEGMGMVFTSGTVAKAMEYLLAN